eukprot:m.178553 g.178553  ORF g.178553 m.178553 type:complete len:93 (+) comp16591_c0_seq1:954-1232(+)
MTPSLEPSMILPPRQSLHRIYTQMFLPNLLNYLQTSITPGICTLSRRQTLGRSHLQRVFLTWAIFSQTSFVHAVVVFVIHVLFPVVEKRVLV